MARVVQVGTTFAYARTNRTSCCYMQRVTHVVSGGGIGWIFQCDNCGWVLGVSLRSGIKTTEFTIENSDITSLKKSQCCTKCWKDYDDNFFFLMKRVFCISTLLYQSHTITAVYYQEVLQKMTAHFKKNKKALKERLKKFFCITTMLTCMLHTSLPNFWRNEASELFHTLHII